MDRTDRLHLMTTFRTHCQNGGGVYDFIQQSSQRLSGEVLEALVAEYCSRVRDPHRVADVLDDLLQFPKGPVQQMVLEGGFKILAGRMIKSPEVLTPWFCYLLSTYDVKSTSTLRMLLADPTKWQAARHYILNAPEAKRPGLEDMALSLLVRNVWSVPEAFIDLIPHLTHLKSPQIYSAYLKNSADNFNKPGVPEVMLNALAPAEQAVYFLGHAAMRRPFLTNHYRDQWGKVFPHLGPLIKNAIETSTTNIVEIKRHREAFNLMTLLTLEALHSSSQNEIAMSDLGELLGVFNKFDPNFVATHLGRPFTENLDELRNKHQQSLLHAAIENNAPNLVGKRKM